MRVLFDQGTPVPIRRHLTGHTVSLSPAGFEILLTTDKNLRYQPNLTERSIAIVVIGHSQWPALRPHVQLVVEAINTAPFLDILYEQKLGALRMAAMITASGTPSISEGIHRIAKTDLAQLRDHLAGLQDQRPADQHRAVRNELQNIRMLSSANGGTRFTSSEHDDLVMAFALAAWPARKFLGSR